MTKVEENPRDGGAWWAAVFGVTQSRTQLKWLSSSSSQGYGFSSGHMDVRVGLWRKLSTEELMLLNYGVGEDSWESLDCKEIQPFHPKGDQSCVFIERTDVEAETPILWPPDVKSWLIWKDPDAGKDWGQEEKGTTEDEMVEWHHWLDGHEFEWTLRDGDGQGGLACCDSWGCRVGHDWATELNWTETLLYHDYIVLFILLKFYSDTYVQWMYAFIQVEF